VKAKKDVDSEGAGAGAAQNSRELRSQSILDPGIDLLSKPFNANGLLTKVREALDAESSL